MVYDPQRDQPRYRPSGNGSSVVDTLLDPATAPPQTGQSEPPPATESWNGPRTTQRLEREAAVLGGDLNGAGRGGGPGGPPVALEGLEAPLPLAGQPQEALLLGGTHL